MGDKKKRGVAGATNAKSIPFRYNGWSPDWRARAMGCYRGGGAHSSGSITMRGLLGGMLATSLGYRAHGNLAKYDVMADHAMDRCTHPLLTDNGDALAEAAE